jgi:phospholipase C
VDEHGEPHRDGTSRRDFLRAGGAAAAGVVAGGVIGGVIGHQLGARDARPVPDPQTEPGFAHLVVLMGENRSFDNLLGYLYDSSNLPEGERFDGLAFGDHANIAPDGTRVAAHPYTGTTDEIMRSPEPDPGEPYPHVNTQLFGVVKAPHNVPDDDRHPTMEGFITDYAINWTEVKGAAHPPTTDDLAKIMGAFTPEMLPVLSTLARNFAIYDHWFAAVPSQTFCNRSFFHASTSHGFVTNKEGGGYGKWLDAPAVPTVFSRLEDAGIDWRVYYDDLQLVSLTGVLHAPSLERFWKTSHFAPMSQFYDDVEQGRLPAYSFIEPRMVYNHNDFHPAFGELRESDVDGTEVIDSAISDVRAGELLVHDIYTAIRASSSSTGSNALNTLFLITFDEHGGTYDHVPPPAERPPDDTPPGEMGFRFDRLGCRVPAIAISAWTAAGTIVHDRMHHGSVAATLERLHGLEPLSRRDEEATPLFNAVNLGEPRHPSTWPTTTPQYLPPNPQAEDPHPGNAHRDKPLSPPAQGLLGLLLAKYGNPEHIDPHSYGDAYEVLTSYGVGLFGQQGTTPSAPATPIP